MTSKESAEGISVVLCVHCAKEISSGFVVGTRLLADPMEAEAVTQASEHSHKEHRVGFSHTAEVVEVADVEPLVKTAFDTPRSAIELEPVEDVEFLWRQVGE